MKLFAAFDRVEHPVVDCSVEPSMAKQSFAEECDINTIVRRFGLTGQLPTNLKVPFNGDFEEVFDFQSAMNTLRAAQESFMELPAHVRARFHNEPGELVDFISKEDNRAEAEKLGIVMPPVVVEPPAPMKVEVVNPVVPDAK